MANGESLIATLQSTEVPTILTTYSPRHSAWRTSSIIASFSIHRIFPVVEEYFMERSYDNCSGWNRAAWAVDTVSSHELSSFLFFFFFLHAVCLWEVALYYPHYSLHCGWWLWNMKRKEKGQRLPPDGQTVLPGSIPRNLYPCLPFFFGRCPFNTRAYTLSFESHYTAMKI